ncbi:beta-lactamase family protein [Clostridium sp. D2Q-11]|uniref:Beta-lactamase family protein n=1 Tax=Anaeromonas frigoriresistens TaxID=2683708 RepID=A0A942Z821_9FIRM|nr:serine hydrolase domain-containing protein [Anaeromonas frigoriresistens]MBS4537500.1 beta-lactamase family protein [Anaeromonas frigoriresistens]
MKSKYEINKLNEELKNKYHGKTPGISIMAIKDKDIVYNEQFGLANLEYEIPMTTNTVFNIASITKQFTGMAIMILEERGLLKYEDMITDYFLELTNYQGVKIRHLLNNTSGIENYYRIIDRLGISPSNISNKEVFELLIKEKKLLFEPGSKFDYSNSNWVLLALLIKKITGVSYKEFIEKSIFNKLGMKNSIIFTKKQQIVKNRAYGYRYEYKNIYCDYVESLTVGDGGIFTTIEDLYKWDQALYTEELVSKESIELSFTNGSVDGEEAYGFGWSIGEDDSGTRKIWHTGLDAGFRSVITRYLDSKFTVIILSNSSACSWDERKGITNELYNIFNR